MNRETPDFRSQGLIRRVLIVLHNAPTGCFILSGLVIGQVIAWAAKPVVMPLIKRILCALIPSCDPLRDLP